MKLKANILAMAIVHGWHVAIAASGSSSTEDIVFPEGFMVPQDFHHRPFDALLLRPHSGAETEVAARRSQLQLPEGVSNMNIDIDCILNIGYNCYAF